MALDGDPQGEDASLMNLNDVNRWLLYLVLFLLALVLFGGCGYHEPAARAWSGPVEMGQDCSVDGIAIVADHPVNCAAVRDDVRMALEATQLPSGATAGLVVRYETPRCLADAQEGAGCVYGSTLCDGDEADWGRGCLIRLNENGTQLAHEMWHVRAAFRNLGGNSQHEAPAWMPGDRERLDAAAEMMWSVR